MSTYRRNFNVFLALAVLTVLEYVISTQLGGSFVVLVLIALVKAGLIVNYFMHVYRLWRQERH